MPYFIKHIIETKVGRILVDFRDILTKTCKKCNKHVPVYFYGETPVFKELCVYETKDIVDECRNTPVGFIPKKCKVNGCKKWRY